MKKLSVLLFSTAILLTGCAANNSKTGTDSSSAAKSTLTSSEKKVLKEATTEYKAYVQKQIDQLLVDTEKFRDTLKEGKLDEAKKMYPLIRMSYESAEPLAESFTELDTKIDIRLVDYVKDNQDDSGWRGFHRIEKIMWEQNTTDGTSEYADLLVNDVKELDAKIATIDVTTEAMLTGAVDLLNEVADTKITGEEEAFSHTDLYDFRANIQGAEKIFELLKPSIEKQDAKLVKTLETNFKEVNELLDKHMTDSEHYKSYNELSKEDIKELSESVAKLGEPLSQMGIILKGE